MDMTAVAAHDVPPSDRSDLASVEVVHLRRGGTSLLLALPTESLPAVLHWGPPLAGVVDGDSEQLVTALTGAPTDSAVTKQDMVAVLPEHSAGWLGRPGLLGSRAGGTWSVRCGRVGHSVEEAGCAAWPDGPAGAVRVVSRGVDLAGRLSVETEIELLAQGLVRLRATVRNLGAKPYEVRHLEPALPVPDDAVELLDMAGRHNHERAPQRRPFDVGTWARESWQGRPGHDAATVLWAGQAGFSFRSGRVWGVHVAWSGNQSVAAERSFQGWRLLRGGELVLPGEIRLLPDAAYRTPWLVGSWGEGLDQASGRIHGYLRARAVHPTRPRPVLLNTWEAVYFNHDLERLRDLATVAAEVGVERFVLDDGWFRRRRDDTTGLGDWVVDRDVWPAGLHPIVDHVRSLGMEFGLWFEPEMVSMDSDLATEHPEWLFATDHGPGIPSRHQHVLDLGHPGAYAHVLDQVSAVVADYRVDFVKWDHNRPLIDAGHQPDGHPGVHLQTQAAYRLMSELKRRHPGLEIEACAGGGGRIDLGITEHVDRAWVSDCIDAHERHRIARYTGLLLPPELMGTHIGDQVDHTTGRSHELSFRAGTAIWGHLGVEWDLTRATGEERRRLRDWIAFHKRMRPLLHHGDVVHADLAESWLSLDGVVAPDRSEALYRLSALEHAPTLPGRIRLPGLDPRRRYRVTCPDVDGASSPREVTPWMAHGVELTGDVLGEVGLRCPMLDVDRLVLIHLAAC